MPSFDVVSEIELHEVDNAVQQANKEVTTRYDFRGTDSSVERTADGIVLRGSSEGRLEAALTVLREKCARRNVSVRALDASKPESGARGHFRQLVKLKQGIEKEKAKQIIKFIKDEKLKVQAAIQGEQLRITGKKRDDLQTVIRALKEQDFDVDLQFNNFRD